VECSRQHQRVVGDVENYRIGIVCDRIHPDNMESRTVVDYHYHKLKDVDQYKLAIIVAAPETECTLNHFFRETNVPPESQCNWEPSSVSQGTISNCHSKSLTRD
jgi:hypothetical protein